MTTQNDGGTTPVAIIAGEKCIGCEQCVAVCPMGAISMNADDVALVDLAKCNGCAKCPSVCPSSAISMSGTPESRESKAETPPLSPPRARGGAKGEGFPSNPKSRGLCVSSWTARRALPQARHCSLPMRGLRSSP